MSCDTTWVDTLYGLEDEEVLTKESVAEVVEQYIDDNCHVWTERPETHPDVVEVHKYRRKRLPLAFNGGHSPLDHLLDYMDEEYGGGEEFLKQPAIAMVAMKAAEAAFLQTVRAQYHVWQMESVAVIRASIHFEPEGK